MILHHTRTLDYETCKAAAAKFKSRGEFSKGDSVAYRKCCKMGWIDDFIPEKKKRVSYKGRKLRAPRRVLDFKTCQESAKKASGRKDFCIKDYQAYRKSCKMGWIKKFFPKKIVRKSEVTFTLIKKVVKQLKAEGKCLGSDLKNYNAHLYAVAWKNGWLRKLGFPCREEAMKISGARHRKYSEEQAFKIARRYKTLRAFRTKQRGLYCWCIKMGLVEKFTWLKRETTSYSRELILETVAKYTDYTKFYKENSAMYGYMCKNKLLHLASSLERRVQFRDGYALDTVYVYEFPETNHAYVGRTVDLVVRDWDHHNRKEDAVLRYSKENTIDIPAPKILAEGITVLEGKEMEQKMMDLYRANGWELINSVRGGSLGSMGYNRRWTMDAMLETASNFEYWDDLEEAHRSLVQKIHRKKLKHLFPWLKYKKAAPGEWKNMSEAEAYEYAKKFKTVTEFADEYSALAGWARKKGWTKKWFGDGATSKQPVEVYSLDKKLLYVTDSCEAAAKAIGIKPSWVHHVCKYKPMVSTCGGYYVKYANDSAIASREEMEAMENKNREYRKKYYPIRKARENREENLAKRKAYRDGHRAELSKKAKEYSDAKKAAGYRYRRDPVTGKQHWVFVGLPGNPETSTDAA